MPTTEELIAAFKAQGGKVTNCATEMPAHMRWPEITISNEQRRAFRRDKRLRARQPARIVIRDRLVVPDGAKRDEG